MNTQTEAIAQVDAQLSTAGLDTYTGVLDALPSAARPSVTHHCEPVALAALQAP
ncbi:hypothetical protein I6G56_01315 (plasmid) [Burkholderia humptydooensis]|uniref:Uncharacterized protein n=1 Tax=Burkholderia humptydooensis TaxID=430531 RepID=A0A7T2TXQ2_9BURK|nr:MULTISPECIES: hypothetical protein [Burkholderia]AJY38062.1 hypothetical protein BW21_6316 [Burkholderia sp. 2002721687]QPS41947.1 hypothetical protein I6G56_01315 [Burkholderia humptydooensis]